LIELSIKTEKQMNKFAEDLDFEKAIQYREDLKKINEIIVSKNIITK
jgi:excinuclease ABC subunit B